MNREDAEGAGLGIIERARLQRLARFIEGCEEAVAVDGESFREAVAG
jgi:hypothetical protein